MNYLRITTTWVFGLLFVAAIWWLIAQAAARMVP